MLDAVAEAVALLLENSQAGSPREVRSPRAQGIRWWAPREFQNDFIFYRVVGDDADIVRFGHGARDLPRFLDEDG